MEFFRQKHCNGLPFPSPRDPSPPRDQTHSPPRNPRRISGVCLLYKQADCLSLAPPGSSEYVPNSAQVGLSTATFLHGLVKWACMLLPHLKPPHCWATHLSQHLPPGVTLVRGSITESHLSLVPKSLKSRGWGEGRGELASAWGRGASLICGQVQCEGGGVGQEGT